MPTPLVRHETPDDATLSGQEPSAARVSVVDLTTLRRIKGCLNLGSHAGELFAGVLVVGSFAYHGLLLAVPLALWGSRRAWRGDIVAPALLTAVSILGMAFFMHEYTLIPERFSPLEPPLRELSIRTFRFGNALAACILATFALAFTLASWAAIYLHGSPPETRGGGRRHDARALLPTPSRRTIRAGAYFVASGVFALIALSPAIIEVGGAFVSLPTARVQLVDMVRRPLWQIALMLGLIVSSGYVAIALYGRAKRLGAMTVREVRQSDPRPPVLLLRSFGEDVTSLARTTDAWGWMRAQVWNNLWTLEETIEHLLRCYGPVIAIGRPGETLPPAGAAREYIANDAWRERVAEYIADARMIIVVLGTSAGLEYEYATLRRLGALSKVIVVFPPRAEKALLESWAAFTRHALVVETIATPADIGRTLTAVIRSNGELSLFTCARRDDEDCYRLALGSAVRVFEPVAVPPSPYPR